MTSDPNSALVVLAAAVDGLATTNVDELGPAELLALCRDLEQQRRRLDAVASVVVGEIDASAAHAHDGHFTTKSAIQHLGRLSPGEATTRVKTARALRAMPVLADAALSGTVPVGHQSLVARLFANPRIKDVVADSDAWFAEHAAAMPFKDFKSLCQRYEQLADMDGAESKSDRQHANRRARVIRHFDGTISIEGTWGGLQGEEIAAIIDRFYDAEFDAEWAKTKADHGPDAKPGDMPRTNAQRLADAILAMCRNAAVETTGVVSDPLVNIVIDSITFERAMRWAAGERVGPDDPTRATSGRCETDTGTRLSFRDIAEAAIVGHVRRVVYDSDGVVIDLGRKQRLFTRGARDAVLLGGWPDLSSGCFWPGCNAPPRRLQCDHHEGWQYGGPTSPANGDAACGAHNRLKETGYVVRRAGRGRVPTRPDGTTITAAI